MGACATKPKADATDVPPPLPEKDEVEKKELTVVGSVIETKEFVDADKSRSLSNLFKQSEEVKGSTGTHSTPTEMVKEEACEAEEGTDVSETKTIEVIKSEISAKTTITPTVVPVFEAEKAIEVEAATDKFEISLEKTAMPIADAPALVKPEESIEVETAKEETETLEEKTSTLTSHVPVDDGAEKDTDAALATENQETVAIEDKKIDEHDKGIETPISESVVESDSSKTEFVEDETSSQVVYAHVEADTKIEAAANETQIAEAVEEKKIEEHEEVEETLNPESPKNTGEESKEATELEKPAILPEKEKQDSKIEEEIAVTENQKPPEETTTETEVAAEIVKP
ncbi:hypothetical protein ACET3Z_001044 [Daucus carota]